LEVFVLYAEINDAFVNKVLGDINTLQSKRLRAINGVHGLIRFDNPIWLDAQCALLVAIELTWMHSKISLDK